MLSYWDPIVLLYGNLITGRYIYWCRALEVNCHKICFTTVLIYLKTRSLERPYWCLNSRESDGIKNILSTIGNTLPPGQRGGLCPAYDTVCNQPTDLRGIRPKLPQVSTNWRCNHLVQRVINQRTKRIVGTTCSSSGEIFQGLQRLPLPATTKKLHGWGRYTACYWASVQSNPPQGWTTPTALRSVRHSVVELVHPTLAIGTSNLHQALFRATSRTHTTSCSSVWASSRSLLAFPVNPNMSIWSQLAYFCFFSSSTFWDCKQGQPSQFDKQDVAPIPVIPFSVNSFIKTVPASHRKLTSEQACHHKLTSKRACHPKLTCELRTSMPCKVQIDNIMSPPHCLSLQTIFVLLLDELIKTIKKCLFCWLWKFLTMKCSHSSGSNERQLFSADRYFLDKGSEALAWRHFLTANKQMLRPVEFQPVFAIFQWPALAKVAHLKDSTVIPELNHCSSCTRVDPDRMSCHPFAFWDTTNYSRSSISKCKKALKISHLKCFWLTLLLRRNAFQGQIAEILVSV